MNLFKRDHLVSMLAGPIIWAGHFVLSYALVSIACPLGWSRLRVASLDLTQVAVLMTTIGALVLLVVAIAANLKKWSSGASRSDHGVRETSAFIAICALLLCLLSAIAVLWVALPALMLPACGR